MEYLHETKLWNNPSDDSQKKRKVEAKNISLIPKGTKGDDKYPISWAATAGKKPKNKLIS